MCTWAEELRQTRRIFLAAALVFLVASAPVCPAQSAAITPAQTAKPGLAPILDYISAGWDSLTRSMSECKSIVDPKVSAPAVLYLPKEMEEPAAIRKLAASCNLRVEHLPISIHHLGEIDVEKIQPPGLLYLENPYVVPGGRFNEMYGWDSYFIIRGLLRASRVELAKDMVDNFFFEVEHYGAMLNANRTYYLTRSQPPFLSSMVVAVYESLRSSGKEDPAWLARAYADVQKDYEMWNADPHRAGETGLSRYYDFGEGAPPEALQDESGSYRKAGLYFLLHPAQADGYVVEDLRDRNGRDGGSFSLTVCDSDSSQVPGACEDPRPYHLSADFYKGDRSMRESGFDVTFRFGPFGAATHHYAPVCLNSLLYKTEKDLQQLAQWLNRPAEAAQWEKRSQKRRDLMAKYLWDPAAGMFFDFNFAERKRSAYEYATTLYPLWAGLATPEQAKAVVRSLPRFEKPGGLAMSTQVSGAQWDLPYGWGNIELLAVEGLRRYGFHAEADRISYEFLAMVAEDFRRDGTIREKYNVVTRSSETHAEVGYPMNVVGFGWTNAAFLELLHALPPGLVDRLEQEQDHPLPAQ